MVLSCGEISVVTSAMLLNVCVRFDALCTLQSGLISSVLLYDTVMSDDISQSPASTTGPDALEYVDVSITVVLVAPLSSTTMLYVLLLTGCRLPTLGFSLDDVSTAWGFLSPLPAVITGCGLAFFIRLLTWWNTRRLFEA